MIELTDSGRAGPRVPPALTFSTLLHPTNSVQLFTLAQSETILSLNSKFC